MGPSVYCPTLDSSIYSTQEINRMISWFGPFKVVRKCDCIVCTEQGFSAFVMTKVAKAIGTSVLVSECGSSFCRDKYTTYRFRGTWDSEDPYLAIRRDEQFACKHADIFTSYDGWEFIGNFSG
jgi:hypothetical protein